MSNDPTLELMIQLIVARRFPALEAMKLLSKVDVTGGKHLYSGKIAEAEAYEGMLRSKSLAESQALHAEASAQPVPTARLLSKAELEEQRRFFNQPQATADFDHWTKTAHWTLDEAVALSFGKDPEVVRWENVRHHTQVSPFAAQYARVRDLTLRALAWKQLYDPVLPSLFLAWAKRTGVSYPLDLEKQLLARGQQVADWKSLYDDARAEADAARAGIEKERQRVTDGMADVKEVTEFGSKYWQKVRAFARTKRLLLPEDEGLLSIASSVPARIPEDWQAARILVIRRRCEEAGLETIA